MAFDYSQMKKQIKIFAAAGILVIAIAIAILVHLNSTGKISYNEKNISTYSQNGILDNIQQYKSDLRQIHCYCGCDHTDLYNCYEGKMLSNCGTCMGEYKDYLSLRGTKPIGEISKFIDEKYKDTVPDDDD